MKNSKIDKFYILLALVLTIVSIFVILTFREVFTALRTINEIEEKVPDQELKVNKDRLDEAYTSIFEREIERIAAPQQIIVEEENEEEN